jgi:hypothetical protein
MPSRQLPEIIAAVRAGLFPTLTERELEDLCYAAGREHQRAMRDPVAQDVRERSNYRGRRLRACRACEELHYVIEKLGVEDDPSVMPIPNHPMPPAPSLPLKHEMQNTVANLLRMILLHNDGQVSPQKLNRF